MSNERSEVTDATRRAEAEEAKARHEADAGADPEDEKLFEEHGIDDGVREHYREMTELGAHEVGEGRIP